MNRENIQHWLALMAKVPDCRNDLINNIKEDIKNGSYVTEEKLEIAYTRLVEELFDTAASPSKKK